MAPAHRPTPAHGFRHLTNQVLVSYIQNVRAKLGNIFKVMSTTISFLSDSNIQLYRLLLFYKKFVLQTCETWRGSLKNHHPTERGLSLLGLPCTLMNTDDLDSKNIS